MKKLIEKFKRLTISQKVQLIAAMIFTIAFMVSIPVYAWFANQKKAAEMFKVEFPNALYINAAHREDQVNFALDGINVNEYETNDDGSIKMKNDEPVKITEKLYVFSVSGSNTNRFILQMSHTNNNLFTYTVYEATEATDEPDSGIYVEYIATDEHTENTMVFTGDTVSKDDILYYVMGEEVPGGEYKNMESVESEDPDENMDPTENSEPSERVAISDVNDHYYYKTYGDNDKVEAHAVPSYWQATINADQGSNKQFCKYFILKVTWDDEEQSKQTDKETDLVCFSVQRKD